MTLEHVALWTLNLESLKDYYVRFFNGIANKKYVNHENGFESYFITFGSGTRLELMHRDNIPENMNDREFKQHLGFIHLAFRVDTPEDVEAKSAELRNAGFRILRGPRKTGDGYYEFETLDPDGNRVEVMSGFDQKK